MSDSYGQSDNGNGARQYLRQQIEQAGPIEQVLMLYDGILKFMGQAKTAIEKGDVQSRHNANQRALEIVAYLIDMVNPETGGEAGKRLFGIYSALMRRMLQVDFENNPAICDEVSANIRMLRVAMAQALAQSQAQSQSAPAAMMPPSGAVVAAPTSAEALPPVLRRGAVA